MGIIRRRRFKLGSYPKEDEFPYKHNYEAMRGGHSVNDIDTGWDANGIPYKKESENQRLFRFEQMIKKENNRNRKRKLLETITIYMRNTRNYFRWRKTPPKMVNTNVFQVGPYRLAQASNAKTTNIHKWLHDKKK